MNCRQTSIIWAHHSGMPSDCPTWRFDGLLRSPPGDQRLLESRDEVVRGERASTCGGGRAAQLRRGEAELAGTGAWPREAERIILPGGVDRVPGVCRRVLADSRDVMVSAEVIRRRDVLSLGGPGRLRVVHPGGPTGERVLSGVRWSAVVDLGVSGCLAHVRPPPFRPDGHWSNFSLRFSLQLPQRRNTPL